MKLTVFVPVKTPETSIIIRGSAIVGSLDLDDPDGMWKLDYEGDKHGGHRDFRDRLICAAGRHVQNYPTVARMFVAKHEIDEHFIEVGSYEYPEQKLVVTDADALTRWLTDRVGRIKQMNLELMEEFENNNEAHPDLISKIALIIGARYNEDGQMLVACTRATSLSTDALTLALRGLIQQFEKEDANEKSERTQPS